MKIAFVDLSGIDFTPLTPEVLPLGGMQSGVSYLSRELAARGHEVTIFNGARAEGTFCGVRVLNFRRHFPAALHDCDFYISISCSGLTIRPFTRGRPLILLTGHSSVEPSMQALAQREERDCWDHFVFKSNWQAEAMRKTFSLDPGRISIITNAVSPAFEALAEPKSSFLLEGRPPVLYFSSTPFRGLDILVRAFPAIAKAVPGVTARVYSSMAPYQAQEREAEFGDLYRACRAAGMDYVGSLSQPQLCEAVASADVLAFPSTYPETSCITLMEAMAASNLIVSRALGAIPETAAGFGYLLAEPARLSGAALADGFARHVIGVLKSAQERPRQVAARLRLQRRYCLTNYSWPSKAKEWEATLAEIAARVAASKSGVAPAGPANVYNYVQTLDGDKLYLDPRDGRARRLMARRGVLNPETNMLWKAALKLAPWSVIVDVGANYGEMLLDVGVAACSRVIAVEPSPRILPRLRRTVAQLPNVEVVAAALAESEGERRFAENLDWSGMSRLGDGPNAVDVKTTTLDALLAGEGRGEGEALRLLLKIDVEGDEPAVLRGGALSIARASAFCGLIEVSNLPPEEAARLERRFDIYALDVRQNKVVRVASLAQLQATPNYWKQDALIFRKSGQAAAPMSPAQALI